MDTWLDFSQTDEHTDDEIHRFNGPIQNLDLAFLHPVRTSMKESAVTEKWLCEFCLCSCNSLSVIVHLILVDCVALVWSPSVLFVHGR